MKKQLILLVAATALTLTSCGKASQSKQQDQATTSTQITTLTVDSLLNNAEAYIDQQVTVSGLCTHICSHGAEKIFLMGSDDTQVIRIQASKEIGTFKQECVNSLVQATGTLVEERIDEAYLTAWEAAEAANTAEHHGDNEEGGCTTEKAARGESGNSTAARIADFRTRIAQREATEGKAYLSFYHIEGQTYTIQ